MTDVSTRKLVRAAMKRQNVVAYQSGKTVTLVVNASLGKTNVTGTVYSRTLQSAGLARAVLSRLSADAQAFPDHGPGELLEASSLLAESAWRHACRRMGRRVP
jgi:hypothetical protein